MQTGHTLMAIKYFQRAAAVTPIPVYFANLAQALWSVGQVRPSARPTPLLAPMPMLTVARRIIIIIMLGY